MNWSQVITGILPLLGVIVGGYATYLTQTRTLDKKLERELERDQESRNIERMTVYSEISKLDGENEMYMYGGRCGELNLGVFRNKFRPVLFSKFYLLDQEIADIVREMDNIVMLASLNGELTIEQHDGLSDLFNMLIEGIELKLKDYRNEPKAL